MAYRIAPEDRNASAMLRRVARSELNAALREATRDDAPVRIHDLRKSVKKTRGLLRLFSPRMSGAKAIDHVLSQAARGISELREAEVMRAMLKRLGTGADEPEGRTAARALLSSLPAQDSAADPDAIARFAEQIAMIQQQAKHWEVQGRHWSAFGEGVNNTYAQGARRMRKARDSGLESDLHSWRTRAKQHWYQARLLHPIWPEMMSAHIAVFDSLGEMIGDHHDLHLLRPFAAAHLPADQASALDGLIKSEMHRLEVAAFKLGARAYAERPEALVERWGAWFKLWRKAA